MEQTFARNYYLLTKPGIIFGNIITMAGGFSLAVKNHFPFLLFIQALIGLALVIASSCVYNNYIDREADKKMQRTKQRSIALQMVTEENALLFATILGLAGFFLLALYTNLTTTLLALFGFVVYVMIYSFSKYRSTHGTLIGSLAGAVPPVIGYCSITNQLDLGALLLFTMMALWQMPHFYAIAIYRLEDYQEAFIPVLPSKKGTFQTKMYMFFYILLFLGALALLFITGYVEKKFLLVSYLLGFWWLFYAVKGLVDQKEEKKWARKMFIISLFVIIGLHITLICSSLF